MESEEQAERAVRCMFDEMHYYTDEKSAQMSVASYTDPFELMAWLLE